MFKRFALTATVVLMSMGQVYAIVYPTLTPTGETPGGAFQTYFDNMYTTTQCNTLGQVVGGFTSSGVPICQTPVASGLFFFGETSGDTIRFDGTNWIRNNFLYNNGTNIGIGNQSPTATLDINGQIRIRGGSPGSGKLLMSDTTGIASWYDPLPSLSGSFWTVGGNTFTATQNLGTISNQVLPIITNNIERMRIDTAGNVGIGTATPGARLEVAGQVRITGGGVGSGKFLVSDATGLATWTDIVPATSFNISGSTLGDTLYYNGTDWVRTNNIFHTGSNVGIGTVTPGAKLEVNGQVKITGGGVGSGLVLTSDASGLASWQAPVVSGVAGGQPNYIARWLTNTTLGTGSIYDNGTNVGIGTATPGARLDIVGGDIIVNGIVVGRGGSNVLGNTTVGGSALSLNTSGASNSAFGFGALYINTTGFGNTANGAYSLYNNSTGNQNTAVGNFALGGTNGSANSAFGHYSLRMANTGNYNSAFGQSSFGNLVTGSYNTGLGYNAGDTMTGGSYNIAIGANANPTLPNGSNQLNIGNWIYGDNGNIGIGTGTALTARLSINGQVRITGGSPGSGKILTSDASGLATWVTGFSGSYTASGITGGTENYVPKFGTGGNGLILSQLFDSGTGVGIGTTNPAAKLDVVGGDAIINGVNIGIGPSGNPSNLAVGRNALALNIPTWDFWGNNNTAVGTDTLYNNIDGFGNTAIGNSSLYSNISGGNNTAIGTRGLYNLLTGETNISLGQLGLENLTTGNSNISIGAFALNSITSSNYNIGVGDRSFSYNVNGDFNVGLGHETAYQLETGSRNTFLGYAAGYTSLSGSNNIAIGANTNPVSTTASNQLNIGNLIYGSGLIGTGAGNIGIGVTNPLAKLDINGQIKISGGSPGSGKILTSDASGLATWTTGFSGSYTASGITGGTQHYVPKFGTGGNGLVLSQIYDTGTGVVIGATTLASRFEIWSGATSILHMRGTNNLGFGSATVRTATSGSSNVGFGSNVLRTLTTGYSNTAMGVGAGYNTTTGFFNSAFGESALYSNSIGNWNSALGTQALWTNLDGSYNVAFGGQALYSNLNNDNSVAIGYQALRASTADNNIAIGYMAGSGITTGANNIMIGSNVAAISNTASNQLNIGNWIYGSGGNIGIGTGSNLTARINIDSGVSGVTGLRLPRVNNNSPVFTGSAVGLGIDGSGNVVPVSNGDVVVYDALGRSSAAPTPDPDIAGRRIRYDFNKYFQLPTKQSFVVSNGNGAGFNAPYFKEDGVSGICSWNGASGTSPYDCAVADPVTGLSASPNNSFTMTARGDNYGYQLALGARGDAPLFARSGRWFGGGTNYGSGLYLADGTTPTPWQKVLTVPANHIEYFYVNIGYNSQLQEITGGGNIGMGTSTPDMRLVLAYSGTVGSTEEMMRIQRGVQGADANMVNAFGTPYLMIGGEEKRTGSIQAIGFGYTAAQSAQPAEIGLVTTNTSGNTQGDLVFATRNATTNTAPSERMRIFSNGNVTIGSTTNSAKLRVDGQVMIVDGSQGAGRVLTSDANGLATWQAPSGGGGGGSGAYTSVLTSAASRTSNVLGDLGLSSPYLPVGYYNFRFTARFRTAATTTGIGVALAANGATVTNYGGQFIAQTATNATQTYSDATLGSTTLLSTAVPAANTDYIATYQGVFQVTSAGAVKIQYRSEVNGSNVTIQPGSNLIIEPL